MKRTILGVLLIALLGGGYWSYRLVWGKPMNFDHMLERYLIEFALSQPELLTMVGVVDNTLLDFHSGKLSDASPAETRRTFEQSEAYLDLLHRYDRDRLEGQQRISYDMMDWLLGTTRESEAWLYHDFPVNQVSGIQSDLPSFMDTYHRVVSEKSAENYISRLKAFRTKFGQVGESITLRADRGIVPPRFIFVHVLRDMAAFIAPEPAQNILFTSFVTKLDSVDGLPAPRRAELEVEALAAVTDGVYPAYRDLMATLETIRPLAREESGAWTLPDGDAYYRYMVRYHTSLDVSPEEVHETGLREVARIQAEMFDLFARIGISSGTVAERFRQLDGREGTFYPDTPDSYPAIIADYQATVDRLYEGTASFFKRVPTSRVEVRRVPEHAQKTAPFAYYSIPALDGTRPGIFFINLRSVPDIRKYGMMTLTAHEAVPGHHFQLALAQEIKGVPTVRRLLPFSAYAEGWALYTERIVAEAGLYADDPESDLGRLQAEMFRAVRLVVDTGMHLHRWTRQEAIDYMLENTGMPEVEVVAEIERYLVWPGQALAYKMGMLHILDLRRQAETELGQRFDLADFHDVILMNGSLPLTVLTGVVEDYIRSVQVKS